MTTDTKAVTRWDRDSEDMHEYPEGDYVLFTDHERVVGELQAARDHDFKLLGLADGNIAQLRTALAASRAEVEGLKRDAQRWGHVRKLLTVDDIFNRQRELDEWQNLVSEEECERADKAIDAAMEKGNV